MSSRYRWVDDVWWRDWVLWVGVVVATVNLVAEVGRGPSSWWSVPLHWGIACGFTIALLGFVRTVIRTYREPPTSPDSP